MQIYELFLDYANSSGFAPCRPFPASGPCRVARESPFCALRLSTRQANRPQGTFSLPRCPKIAVLRLALVDAVWREHTDFSCEALVFLAIFRKKHSKHPLKQHNFSTGR